jgi:hypothetical protein
MGVDGFHFGYLNWLNQPFDVFWGLWDTMGI